MAGLSQTFAVDGSLATPTEFAASRLKVPYNLVRHLSHAEAPVEGRLQGSPLQGGTDRPVERGLEINYSAVNR